MVKVIILVIAYLVCAPLVGGFLAGLDRKISARMQGRVGPPVLQPFYDVLKLTEKEPLGAHWVDSRESSLLRRLERGREIGR